MRVKNDFLLIFLLLAIHLIVLINLQFIAWPEMLSYPYLLKNGYLLYRDIINPYTPFLPYFLKFFFSVFGFNLISLRCLTYFIILITDVLFYIICREITDKKVAGYALLSYVLWQPILEGNGLWFDLFVIPFILACFYLVLVIIRSTKNRVTPLYFFILGLLLGVSFLVKQTCGFLLFAVILLLIKLRQKRTFFNLGFLVFAFLTLLVVSFLFAWQQGFVNDYFFWAFQYPFKHLQSSGFSLAPSLKQDLLLLFLILPAVFAFLKTYKTDKIPMIVLFWLFPLTVFVFPRFSYFHLQPLLPFIIILLSVGFLSLSLRKKVFLSVLYFFILSVTFGYFCFKWWGRQPRFYNESACQKAQVLRNILKDKGPIFYYNLSSEYIFLSGLLPSKPWADTFSWYLEVPGLQSVIVDGLIQNRVKYAIFRQFGNEESSTPGSYKPKIIDNYLKQDFGEYEKIDDDLWILVNNNL